MLKKKNYVILIIVFLAITIQFSLLILQGQTNRDTSKTQPTPNKTKENSSDIRNSFPVAEYSSELLTESERRKSEKYDKGFALLTSEISEDSEGLSTLNWAKDLSALPIDKSNIVVIGKVVEAKAHLSAKKKSVFSEFKIEIEDIQKNNSQQEFEVGKYVTAEREGGVVQYPSGHKLWYRVAGQQMPTINNRYLFFLTNDFPIHGYYKQDFYLLTAYELKKGKVIPLDNPDDTYPIVSTYKDKEESVLLNDLQNALGFN